VSDVITERHDRVLLCRLNRPESLNGLTGALLTEYLAVLEDARTDDGVRVVVTTGEGDAFSAGADVGDLASDAPEQGLNERMHQQFGLTASLSLADRVFDRLGIGRQTLALKNFDKPLIAAVNGAAAGGGFALAMLHDIRLASERATFTTAFVHIGLVADMGLTYTLPRAIGLEAAMDLMYTGRRVSADEARTMGLVRRVVAHDRLLDEAMAYARQVSEQAPVAVQFVKRALSRSLENTFVEQLEVEWPYQVAAFGTEDAREGAQAFVERRRPDFGGS
jgi:2-(1,2-epoxy-1,2-dihydrophenyl)acetyl-CoA isomerase